MSVYYSTISFVTELLLSRPTLNVNVPNRGTEADTLLTQILNTVYFFAGAAAVIAIVVGGFWYITGGDNPQQIQKGKNAIVFASIGLIVVLLAFGITGFVAARF